MKWVCVHSIHLLFPHFMFIGLFNMFIQTVDISQIENRTFNRNFNIIIDMVVKEKLNLNVAVYYN